MHAPFSRCLSGTLADYAPGASPMIPPIIVYCVNEIERRGFREVALYRINGAEKEIHDLKVTVAPESDFHCINAFYLIYLRMTF